jgi:hypothetical protein
MKKILQSVKIKVVLKRLKMIIPNSNQMKIQKTVKLNSQMIKQLFKNRIKKLLIKIK